jgi:cytochrome oxidase Cu insertion factor (SCO1/SenC/PrrC family)
MAKWKVVLLACCLSLGISVAQVGTYPKPQVASATGKPAPDFSLKDHNGAVFSLSKQQGSWVLLYFYRGYW